MLLRYPNGPYDIPSLDALTSELDQRTQPGDAVLPILPVSYLDWHDQYRGSVPDFGVMMEDPLSERTENKLEYIPQWHNRVWLVIEGSMGGNPANGVEIWLAEQGFIGAEMWVEDYRLVPYTFTGELELHPSGVAFGDGAIRLDSYAVEVHRQIGRNWVNILLVWEALANPGVDYTIFAHLLDANGTLIAQHDGLPMAGYSPTRTWEQGDKVEDRRSISLPDSLPPGAYRLTVGFYNPSNGERLPLADGSADVLILETITIPESH
jgi:hypothetical protein